ncbi:ubiquitin-like domain-containing CTD phosphatase 1, partial [Schistocerca gregaria]|uniref:ubiquitin-like domain-containing CTD phosphatase 1 n=1 Tax=Schistocerca gregaria TaxID=7010 RepID=UPI00211EAFC0
MGEFRVCVRWCGDRHELSLSTRSTVLDLKKLLADKTGVPCHRQRLVGLLGPLGVAPSSIGDETKLSEVRIGSGDTIMMIGSSEPPAKMPKCASAGQTTQERASPKERDAPGALEENYRKIESRIRTYRFEQLAEPRKGKKLLVLDIDYTLFECRSCVGNASESTRPHLHEFLAAVYRHYDIFIWSATSLYVRGRAR